MNKSDWIELGLTELQDNGHRALNAQGLAKKLGVSRGSFYWHFPDIGEYKIEIIRAWRLKATEDIINAVNVASTPRQRLELLIKETLRAPKIELSVRAWATTSKPVASTVAEIDAQRFAFVENLLRDIGVKEIDIKYRSKILYWAAVGRTLVVLENLQLFSDDEIIKLADLMSS